MKYKVDDEGVIQMNQNLTSIDDFTKKEMEILVIGGTRYFGIHMVNKLLEQGYKVTIATRG